MDKRTGVMKAGLLAVSLCGVGVFCSCGLDEMYELDAPTTTYHYSTYDTSDPLSWYCDFRTVSQDSSLQDYVRYLGTGVYYKIYNSYSALISQRDSITSLNTTNNGSSAATRMIQTLGFQPLGTSPNLSLSVFVEEGYGSSTRVQFRLKSQASADVSSDSMVSGSLAMIRSGDSYIGYDNGSQRNYAYDEATDTWNGVDFSEVRFVIPYRYDNSHSFDFFDDNDDDDDGNRDVEPVDGDDDYYHSSSASADGTYYVQLFAVSIARSGTYEYSYSSVLDLGAIPIIRNQ